MAVKKGDKVKVEYKGTFEDGTVFDSSEAHGKPLEFEAGSGMVIKGFDNAIIGMEKGDEKDVTIPPADAYGQPKEEMIKEIPLDRLPKEQEIKAGMMLLMGTPDGQQMPVRVAEVGKEMAKLDLNHPLAGKTLKFNLKLVEIVE